MTDINIGDKVIATKVFPEKWDGVTGTVVRFEGGSIGETVFRVRADDTQANRDKLDGSWPYASGERDGSSGGFLADEVVLNSSPPLATVDYMLVDVLRTERDRAVKALEEFKALVHRVAKAEAEERDWCDDINDVMSTLGLPPISVPQTQYRFTITFTTDEEFTSREDAMDAVCKELVSRGSEDRVKGNAYWPELSNYVIEVEEYE